MIEIKNRVTRVTFGKHRGRQLVVSIVPGDCIEIREKGRRKVETISIAGVYDYAILTRVRQEQWLKKQERKSHART